MSQLPHFVGGRSPDVSGTGLVMPQTPILLTIRETAAILRVSMSTIDRMLRRGELPHVKMNYATRILRRDVDAYIESRRVERRGQGAA
ncbi:MAG: helix-turn-helix domain-containing protein [Actinobacteria bacterium]|nr:helix-turn-helix domain-containing protein [Actinomycetota bacterium]